jgi:hypothetical protein
MDRLLLAGDSLAVDKPKTWSCPVAGFCGCSPDHATE